MHPDHHVVLQQQILDLMRPFCVDTTQNDFHDARATILRVVHSAFSEAAELWNSNTVHILALPDEIVVEVFTHMDLHHRVRASCVCRAWRSISLSHPTLWTSLNTYIPALRLPVLPILFNRSAGLPLYVRLSLPNSPPTYSRLIEDNIGRIQHVELMSDIDLDLGMTKAPLLETIIVAGSVVLPYAPLLRTVQVRSVIFGNVGFNLSNLVDFSGLPQEGFPSNFFQCCPCLESLNLVLGNSSQFPYWPRGPPSPRLLKSLSLVTGDADVGSYLQNFHQSMDLRKVQLQGSFTFADVVELSQSLGHPLHSLVLGIFQTFLELADGQTSIRLRAGNRDGDAISYANIRPAWFAALRKLSLYKDTFIWDLMSAGVTLPVLERIHVDFELRGLQRFVSEADHGALPTPSLRFMELSIDPILDTRQYYQYDALCDLPSALLRRCAVTHLSEFCLIRVFHRLVDQFARYHESFDDFVDCYTVNCRKIDRNGD